MKKVLCSSLALAAGATLLSAQTAAKIGNLPLWFEGGEGGATGQFVAHGRNAEFSVTAAGAGFVLRKADGKTAAVNLRFVGAEPAATVAGESKLTGKINYFTGNNPAGWRPGIPTYGKVRLENIYSGINAVFYGNEQTLEYDLNVAAGTDPGAIGIRYDGAKEVAVNSEGELVIGLDGGEVIQHRPVAYQTDRDGTRHEIQAAYRLVDATRVEFALGDYNHHLPLVIDPTLGYATFFGGNFGDAGWAIALDGSDNIYIAGQTLSTVISNKPVIPFSENALYPTNHGGKFQGDAFVAKFDSTGQTLDYCTYLGGSGDDAAYALAVDSAGHAYIAGATGSTNFPTTNWITTATYSGKSISGVLNKQANIFPGDAFVAELETDGSRLLYSTYLGGESTEVAYGLAIDPSGDAYVTGLTYSTNFPIAGNALFSHLQCTNDYDVNFNAFVSEIAPGGNTLNYSTYLGGTNFDAGRAIAYTNGFVYVAGYTASTNFYWTNGLVNCQILNGFTNSKSRFDDSSDAFVTVFTTSGTDLVPLYSTYLGSTNDEVANGIAGDGNGNAYVVGWTTSSNFPSANNLSSLTSYIRTNETSFFGATNAFVTQLLWPGVANGNVTNGYSQIFGGRGVDVANGVALDGAGDVFVVGTASSTNFPTSGSLFGSLRATNSSAKKNGFARSDVFVTAFLPNFSGVRYSTYLGGSSEDNGNAIAVDSVGNAYITGQTLSTDFPTNMPVTVNGLLRNMLDGTNDAFVAEILIQDAILPALSLNRSGTNLLVSWTPNGPETTPAFLSLETCTNLWKTTNWTTVSQMPVNNGGVYNFIFNPTNATRFFRLRSN